MGNKLYVGNLPYQVRDSDLEQAFAQYGAVNSAKVMMERETGRFLQQLDPGVLQADVVVGVEIVQAMNNMTLFQEAQRKVEADKAGAAGNQNAHRYLAPWRRRGGSAIARPLEALGRLTGRTARSGVPVPG